MFLSKELQHLQDEFLDYYKALCRMYSLSVIGFRNKANIYYTGFHIRGGETMKALGVSICVISYYRTTKKQVPYCTP